MEMRHFPILACLLIQSLYALPRIKFDDSMQRETFTLNVGDYTYAPSDQRSVTIFPDTISMDLRSERRSISVNLSRNHDIRADVPITLERQGRIIYQNIQQEPVSFYQDRTTLSSFAVSLNLTKTDGANGFGSTPGIDSMQFVGMMTVDNEQYMVQHSGENDERRYNMYKLPKRSYGRDYRKVQKVVQDFVKDDDGVSVALNGGGNQCKERTTLYRPGRLRCDFHVVIMPVQGEKKATNTKATFVNERRKREVKVNYEVEMLAVADHSSYTFWYSQVPSGPAISRDREAKEAMRKYYALLMNTVDLRYQSITDRPFTIRVLLSAVHVADRPELSPWTDDNTLPHTSPVQVDADAAIDNFRAWWKRRRLELTRHDHAMMFTKYDLVQIEGLDVHKDIVGLAYTTGACSMSRQSIIQDGFDAVASAHELGHSLGADHDDEPSNDCSGADGYIMAARQTSLREPDDVIRRMWTFSHCSLDYFQEFFDSLNDQDANCLLPELYHNINIMDEYKDQLPGQIYYPDFQCKNKLGEGSYFNRGPYKADFSNICTNLYCYAPSNNGTYYTILPMDGTVCGDGKMCKKGVCVPDERSPPIVNEKCMFGEAPGKLWGQESTCSQFMGPASLKYNCYLSYFRHECCETCIDHHEKFGNNEDCPFGDQSPECADMPLSWCYNEHNHNVCCARCQPITNSPDCIFGDHDDDCNAEDCALYSQETRDVTCCATCAKTTTTPTTTTTTTATTTVTPDIKSPACKFGDRAGDCSLSMCPLYDDYTRDELCCGTCHQKSTPPPECALGDLIEDCSQAICPMYDVYTRQELCCETCSDYTTTSSSSSSSSSSTTATTTKTTTTSPPPVAITTTPPVCNTDDRFVFCPASTRTICSFSYFHIMCCATCTKILQLPREPGESTVSTATISSTTHQPTTLTTPPPPSTTPKELVPHFAGFIPAVGRCVWDCTDVIDGDYQSCAGCNVYASCYRHVLCDQRPCPLNLVWSDDVKRCVFHSNTC